MNPIERFASEAEEFEQWARLGTDSGASAARNGLIRLTRLYAAALELPAVSSGEQEARGTRVDDDKWQAVFKHASRLPLDEYGEVFNPLHIPPEEPVIASLADDIADIYRDVVHGLNHYRLGNHQEAAWQWITSLEWHWGEHVSGAIRVLHCWLSQNAPDRLSTGNNY